jgi:hypothetical protein
VTTALILDATTANTALAEAESAITLSLEADFAAWHHEAEP